MSISRISRRTLLKAGAIASTALVAPWKWLAEAAPARAVAQSQNLSKFIQPLRGIGTTNGIPIAEADSANPGWWQPGVTHYTLDIAQFTDQLHPDLPNPTRLWGFGQVGRTPFRHLGGVIAARRGTPVQITFRNRLPPTHILPVDPTIMGVAGNQNNRADIHLHGGLVPWTSDGGPHAWWDPDGHRGPSFVNNDVLRPGQAVPANAAEYYYPNNQGSRVLWYHDHAFGLTRLNAYAGIASAYVIYDDYELGLVAANHLPGPLDPRTVYLIFQDKVLVPANVATTDPTWTSVVPNSQPGDLWYAHRYDGEVGPHPLGDPLLLDPSCVPEFFGDTILVNGKAYPFLEVEQRQYRFRMLNACSSRFLNPRFVYAAGATFPGNAEAGRIPGPAFVHLASEGGFLPAPVYLDGTSPLATGGPTPNQLLLAPAERADLIVDFRNVPADSVLIVLSDAPAPYPMGDDANDFRGPPASPPGFGPNTRTLLQVRVKSRKGASDPAITLPPKLNPTDPFLVKQTPGRPTKAPGNAAVRRLTLNEAFDGFGRLIQFLGTDTAVNDAYGREYMAEPTEIVQAGSTEVWEIANLTGDTHPIHFHLVNVQILSRQSFDADTYAGGEPTYLGDPIAPDPNELGWKETVRMNPGQVTRVLMKFDLASVPFTVPISPRLEAEYGIAGAEYVWHCHILEHEEHDMMRPLVVI